MLDYTLLRKGAYLPCEDEYIIVGDVHGCIDELRQLLLQNGFHINQDGLIDPDSSSKSIILLGDFVDKGSEKKIAQTIEFIYQNYYHLNRDKSRFYLIMGNHEDMIYRYITNDPSLDIKSPKRQEEKRKYYNSADLLERDSELKEKFLMLHRESFPWLKYLYDEHFSVTLTHAPCQEQYLAKDNADAYKKMIKSVSRSKNPNRTLDELIPYLHQEAKENQHYHVFGHLSQPNIRQYKNKICIDTSAIYGNRLSCLLLKERALDFDSTPFLNQQKSATQQYNLLFDFAY
jgi:UDP-2,3-diacylglucosamine pyrophosphatase LpxH